jgi:hypothetical protein
MTRCGLLRQSTGVALTDEGVSWLTTALDVDPVELRPGRRPIARACLDWTERRPHLAGVAGARMCGRFFDRGWIRRVGTSRAVRVTPAGVAGLRDLLGLDPASLD